MSLQPPTSSSHGRRSLSPQWHCRPDASTGSAYGRSAASPHRRPSGRGPACPVAGAQSGTSRRSLVAPEQRGRRGRAEQSRARRHSAEGQSGPGRTAGTGRPWRATEPGRRSRPGPGRRTSGEPRATAGAESSTPGRSRVEQTKIADGETRGLKYFMSFDCRLQIGLEEGNGSGRD